MLATIIDEDSSGRKTASFKLELISETIEARELITKRILQDCTAQVGYSQNSLVRLGKEELQLNKPCFNEDKVDRLCDIALRAFESNRFILLVDDKQIEELDERITLRKGSIVTFLKLVPLQGG